MTTTTRTGEAWLRRFHPVPHATARLLCLPHAGGSASFYFPVSRALSASAPASIPASIPVLMPASAQAPVSASRPASVEVLAAQYPGRQDRRSETCVEDVGELADHLVEALAGWTDRPLALFGHSMGATVAFEVARRLAGAGVTVAALFVSGRRAPSRQRAENIHRGPDDLLLAELKALSGTGEKVFGDSELLDLVLPVIRSDYKAAETYRYQPGPKLACPIVALVGDSDPKVTADDARAWADHTTARFEMAVFPGGHFYLTEHRPAVVHTILDRLARFCG
ncbi:MULTISPECIES: alpha/beta fold hydrolase [unclassified Frankia]|uniref:alpha/beta fold hydrolase n=1 Tax=unclassified Frankia TaxID=2632575 RepID=UPI00202467EA